MAKRTRDEEVTAPATSDAYTGMLAISLVALIAGCVLLFLDYSQYPDKNPPAVQKAPAIPTGGAPAPAPGNGAAPPTPPMGETPPKMN
jgi:hypothetical protein